MKKSTIVSNNSIVCSAEEDQIAPCKQSRLPIILLSCSQSQSQFVINNQILFLCICRTIVSMVGPAIIFVYSTIAYCLKFGYCVPCYSLLGSDCVL